MELNIKVHSNTEDEYTLYGLLENNVESNNLIVMIHSGGMDLHEKGRYVTFDSTNNVYRKNGKTVWNLRDIGNYDIISGYFKDYAVLRYDLRNHGNSLKLSYLDERVSNYETQISDLDEILSYVFNLHNYSNIVFVGTCIGALIITYYLVNNGKYNDKVRGIVFNSPLNNYELTNREVPSLAYKLNKKIFTDGGKVKVLDNMYLDITTFNYALSNLDIGVKLGKILNKYNIKILYAYSLDDRFIYKDHFVKFYDDIKENYKEIETLVLSNELVNGVCDHCFWNPESGKIFTDCTIKFISDVLNN